MESILRFSAQALATTRLIWILKRFSLVRNMIEEEMLLLLGIMETSFEIEAGLSQHKKAGMRHNNFSRGRFSDLQCLNRRRAARSRKQMSNLVIGVGAVCQASRRATSVKDGACGTKLLNGLNQLQWQAGLRFPSGSRCQFEETSGSGQAPMFLCGKFPPTGDWKAPEKQDAQVVDNQRNGPVLFLGSVPRLGGGWSANNALQPTATAPSVLIDK